MKTLVEIFKNKFKIPFDKKIDLKYLNWVIIEVHKPI